MTDPLELGATAARIAEVLDALGVRWAIGGSVASASYGEPRATNDLDVISVMSERQVRGLVARLGEDFYVNEDVAADAARRRASFNIIDNLSLVKIDIFLPPPGRMGTGQLERARLVPAFAGVRPVPILGPEDVILQKLRWFQQGGEVSERQWRDLVSVLTITAGHLDHGYLESVAQEAGLLDLLARARADAAAG